MRAAATITAGALALASTLVGVQLGTNGPARADEVTISQNVSRDGWDSHEPALSPAAVTGKAFGQVFDTPVNGQVYAQPLNVGNSVLVATENDYVYSINRNTGRVIWSRQLGSPYASAAENCLQTPVVQPYIGVTSAPVYDPKTGTLYVSGMLTGPPGDDTNMSTATPTYDLFALNEQTGAIKWKKQIAGSPTNNSSNKFNAALQLQRTGLLLLNGSVYLGFGALCADGAATHQYVGYIAGVNTKTHSETLWTDQLKDPATVGQYGGIWQGGGGLVTDGKSIYFSTANGTAPPLGTKGSAAASVLHLGQSMVKLNVQTNGSLRPADFFSPGDADLMSSLDHDFGSSGPILLPFGTQMYPHLFATADKQAQLYLLNAASLGGRSSSATGSTAVFTGSPSIVGETTVNGTEHGLWGHMAAFDGLASNGSRTDYLYYEGTGWGSQAPMYALRFVRASPSRPVLRRVGSTAEVFGFTSGSPVITSNGRADASAIVWEVHSNAQTGSGGALDAYSAVPSGGVLPLIWSAPIGDASQFSVPATSGGRIYVGARNDASAAAADNATSCPANFESRTYTATDSACVGDVYEFGIFSAHLSAFTVNFKSVALGQTRTKYVTLTNNGDTSVTITKVTKLSAPFRIVRFPALNKPIARGASVRFPVAFTPRTKGTRTGKILVTTTDGFTTHTTTVTVRGVGVAAAALAKTTVSSLGTGGAQLGFGAPVASQPSLATKER